MAAGSLFKYTFLSIAIFCGTKILHFVKQSNDNFSNKFLHIGSEKILRNRSGLLYHKNAIDNQNRNHKTDEKYTNNYRTHKLELQGSNEINVTKDKSNETKVKKLLKRDEMDSRTMTISGNSSSISNRLERQRKLLSQMWDQYYKVKEGEKFGWKNTSSFLPVGSDIFVFSVFHDNRKMQTNQNSFLKIFTISKLQSKAGLQCRFSKTRADQTVPAIKQELSDNHGRPFGGVMYICKVPHIYNDQAPKTVYLQSLLTHEDNYSKVTSALVTVEIIPQGMLLSKSTIYHNTGNQKKFTARNWQTTSNAKQFLETFPKNNSEKILTIDISHTSKGRQLGNQNMQNREELTGTNRKQLNISVCVPPLYGNVRLSEFIQFVEIHKILGVRKIYFYKMNVSTDINRMLHYYQEQGIVTLLEWRLPSELGNSINIWYHGQSTAQQDCLYRNIGKFDFTAFVDFDEVIVPYVDSDWLLMLAKFEKTYTKGENTNIAAFVFQSAFFESDMKTNDQYNAKHQKLSFLKNIYRNEIISSVRTKMIVKPEFIEHVGVHHVSQLVKSARKLRIINVPVELALLHHNRKCTAALDTDMHCGKYVADAMMLKYSDILVKNYEQALEDNMKYFRSIK